MQRFVQTSTGVINLDHVAQFAPIAGASRYQALTANSESLGRLEPHNVDNLPYMPVAVVPDSTGAVLVLVWFNDDGEPPIIDRLPVVAWNVHGDGSTASPVTLEDLPDRRSSAEWFIELPQMFGPQRWVFPGDRRLASLDDAVAQASKRHDWAMERLKEEKEKGEREEAEPISLSLQHEPDSSSGGLEIVDR